MSNHDSRLRELCGRRGLTPRETDVVVLLGDGLTQREVAETLGIRFWTARQHQYRAMDRLGASTVAELIRLIYDPLDQAA